MSDTATLDDGLRMMQANDFHKAADCFANLLQNEPQNAAAFGYLGICLCRTGDLQRGVSALQRAAQLQPADSKAQYNLGVALIQAGRREEAAAALTSALQLDPANSGAQNALAVLNSSPGASPSAAPVTHPVNGVAPAPPAAVSPESPPGYDVGGKKAPGPSAPAAGPAPLNAPVDLSAGTTPAQPPQPAWGATGAPAAAPAQPGWSPAGLDRPGTSPPSFPSGPPPGSGMQYNPALYQRQIAPPSSSARILRGLGWGAVYGQWWTLWNMFWLIFWNSVGAGHDIALYVIIGIVCAIGFGLAGSLLGLIIGAANLDMRKGILAGAAMGIGFFVLEGVLLHSITSIINIFFWYFTGRYVGSRITWRVWQPAKS
ncbi:MAG TPA: tetratricopeptide repeat protein [Chthonomonadales bacterium]|nr:tetratricopeptide repeat protein [Chthonomonadales bacterium]